MECEPNLKTLDGATLPRQSEREKHHTQEYFLWGIFAEAEPELAAIYKSNGLIPGPVSTAVIDLRLVLERIRTIDGGRCYGPTPASADVPLSLYAGVVAVGSQDPQTLLDLQQWQHDIGHTLDTTAKRDLQKYGMVWRAALRAYTMMRRPRLITWEAVLSAN